MSSMPARPRKATGWPAKRESPESATSWAAKTSRSSRSSSAWPPSAANPLPRVRLPYFVALLAGLVSTAWANVTGKDPRVPLDAVKMARKKMWVTHAKAERELGFRPSGADLALRRAVTWFEANGYC